MEERASQHSQNGLKLDQDRQSQAVKWLEHFHDNKAAKWSIEVRMKDGYVCRNCGELDRSLLEAHHIKHKAQFPDLAFNLDNGRCLCCLCHSKQHSGWARLAILARLGLILYQQRYPNKDLSAFNDILGK